MRLWPRTLVINLIPAYADFFQRSIRGTNQWNDWWRHMNDCVWCHNDFKWHHLDLKGTNIGQYRSKQKKFTSIKKVVSSPGDLVPWSKRGSWIFFMSPPSSWCQKNSSVGRILGILVLGVWHWLYWGISISRDRINPLDSIFPMTSHSNQIFHMLSYIATNQAPTIATIGSIFDSITTQLRSGIVLWSYWCEH